MGTHRTALIIGLTTFVLILDLNTPLGIGVWILYCLPLWLLCDPVSTQPRQAYYFTALCSGLIAFGYLNSPPGVPARFAAINRSLGIGSLWMFCAVLLEKNKQKLSLQLREERTRLLLSIVTDVPWSADGTGAFVQPQPYWEAYTGQPWDEHRAFGWLNAIHPEDRERVREFWRRSCEAKRALHESRGRLWHAPTQRYRHYYARAMPLIHTDGEVREWVGTCTDVEDVTKGAAEREVLLQQEQAARRQAEEASRLKDEFLAVLSHELRTPLNSILGWAQLLVEGRVPAENVANAIATIKRNAQNQAKLIEDLLDVSRIVAGKLRLHIRQIDVAAVVTAAIETVRPAAESKGVRIQAIFNHTAGPISGDSQRLQQAFWNLLSNAVKFSEKGGRVQVRIEQMESAVEITVSDTGKGITLEFLPYVFDRFRQMDSSSTRPYGGLGLGLAIVREIVHLHGGEVFAESQGVGRGATFRVSLPRGIVQMPSDTIKTTPPAAQERTVQTWECPSVLRQRRILIVDDEQDSLDVIGAVFKTCDCEIRTATSSGQALDELKSWEPQLLVSDIGMSEEDGYAFIAKVRQLEREEARSKVSAIALTAYARPEDRVRALAAGFQAHLAKPVEPMELVTVAARLMNSSVSPAPVKEVPL